MSTSAGAPRTLADQFRDWTDERLAALLTGRPDLTSPAPSDSTRLASRAVVRLSVQRAIAGLDRLDTGVLTIVANEAPVPTTQVQRRAAADPQRVAAALDRLATLALIWGDDEGWRPISVVADLLAVPPGPDPAEVAGLLAVIDDSTRAAVDHLNHEGLPGTVRDLRPRLTVAQARTPIERALAHGLLVPIDDRHVVVPWTVRLALNDGRSTATPLDVVPPLVTGERDQDLVDRAGAGAAYELVDRVRTLLERWSTRPPAALRSGGIGVRDLKAAAALLHVEAPVAGLVIELAAGAGLLAQGLADADPAWLPTDAFDRWVARPAAEQWVTLARAWLRSDRLLSAIGGRDGDRPVNALAPGLERPWLPDDRRSTLARLTSLAPGSTLAAGTGVPSVVERLRWFDPRRPAARLAHVPAYLAEAALVGLVGLDGLTAFARALLDDADPLPVLTALMPRPVDHVLLQADLTAVAPGPLQPESAARMATVADVESRGGATVYRFTAGSLRRALDAGWSAAEVHGFIAEVSRTPVPQALEFLVDDVVRRFGTLRVGAVATFLRSDDETALVALLSDPSAASLRLRRIAPTVVVSDVPIDVVLPRLREAGVAPVVEGPDGSVQVARPAEFRARTPVEPTRPAQEVARLRARVAAAVDEVRAGDRAAATRPHDAVATTSADIIGVLRQAIEAGTQVWMGYLDSHGILTERVVTPRAVGGGQLVAHDDHRDTEHRFQIHRISQARHLPAAKDAS